MYKEESSVSRKGRLKLCRLEDIGLDKTVGPEGKVRTLLIKEIHSYMLCVGYYEADKQYSSHWRSLSAHHAGYSKTYQKKSYEYFFNINKLNKWFKQNKSIKFNRKEISIQALAFEKIVLLNGIKMENEAILLELEI